MTAGMGGLMQDFSQLVDDQDRKDMMKPKAIKENLRKAGMIKANPKIKSTLHEEEVPMIGYG